nr:immunoglobulin heavy chain junction region [Mus musculus]MBK4198081.1 immunoglobulin heavy chain junction region [Mus musculus]
CAREDYGGGFAYW